jgi:hypothetical protein
MDRSMRKLVASAFVSLDGVMQAPGGPEEDPTVAFDFGGWAFSYFDEAMDLSASGFDGTEDVFDHVKFGVSDYASSKAFFLKALADALNDRRASGPAR